MLKVVFDTNVYISALSFPGSKAEKAIIHAVEGDIELYTSVSILTETAKKLREKFSWTDDKITTAIKYISRVSNVIKPRIKLNILEDIPDNRILECAIEVNADLIVSGDHHLLDLKDYEGIGITKISGFLYTIERRND